MGNTAETLLRQYSMLIQLTEKQLELTNAERYDEQIIAINEIEKEKKEIQAQIELVFAEALNDKSLLEEYRINLTAQIEQLQILNDTLLAVISRWYGEDSKTMKQVSIHRKTLQGYGGANSSDVISYYFDEKQ